MRQNKGKSLGSSCLAKFSEFAGGDTRRDIQLKLRSTVTVLFPAKPA